MKNAAVGYDETLGSVSEVTGKVTLKHLCPS
jgi:hypothetical protein